MNEQTMNPEESREALDTLYNTGMLARTEDEAELLRCFRMLSDTAKLVELARAQGMALVLSYERMKGA